MIGVGIGIGFGSLRTWTPKDLGGLYLWLKADAGITRTGNNVTRWADQSVGGLGDFVQASVGAQPQYVASSQNGLPGISFDGVAQFLASAASAAHADAEWMIGVTMSCTKDLSQPQYILASSAWVIAQRTGNDPANVGWYDGSWEHSGAAPTAPAQVLVYDLRAAAGAAYRNGTQIGTTTAFTASAPSGETDLGCVSFNVAGTAFGGTVNEIVMAASPTDSDRARLTRYLGNKYVISVS